MNKTILLFTAFLTIPFLGFSQSTNKTPSVEKSFFGIQAGLFGAFVYNESKLSNNIALRTEVGMLMGLWGGTAFPKTGIVFTPTISIEPRYYYNLERRVKKGKNITTNSANYFSLKTNYNPDFFVISNYDNVKVNSHITVVPKWGLRRSIGSNFDFEISTGLGYTYDFEVKEGRGYIDLGARIGYHF